MSPGLRRPFTLAALAIVAAGLLAIQFPGRRSVVHAQAVGPGQIAVFSPQSSYAIPVVEVGGQPYVGLVDLLEPLGSVEAKLDGKKLKLNFSSAGNKQQQAEFHDGKNEVKVSGKNLSCRPTSCFRMAAVMYRCRLSPSCCRAWDYSRSITAPPRSAC